MKSKLMIFIVLLVLSLAVSVAAIKKQSLSRMMKAMM